MQTIAIRVRMSVILISQILILFAFFNVSKASALSIVPKVPVSSLGLPLGNECGQIFMTRGMLAYHDGIDLIAINPDNCPIIAAREGVVIYSGWEDKNGYTVKIDHGGSVMTEYRHGAEIPIVLAGDYINKGDKLMQIGCTGFCTGIHLHFSVRHSQNYIDPTIYLDAQIPWYESQTQNTEEIIPDNDEQNIKANNSYLGIVLKKLKEHLGL